MWFCQKVSTEHYKTHSKYLDVRGSGHFSLNISPLTVSHYLNTQAPIFESFSRCGAFGMVHSVSGWTRGVQVKLWDPLRTRTIPERLRGVFTTRRYTNPRLPLHLPSAFQIYLPFLNLPSSSSLFTFPVPSFIPTSSPTTAKRHGST